MHLFGDVFNARGFFANLHEWEYVGEFVRRLKSKEDGGDDSIQIFWAGFWGFVSAVSLIIGCAWGIFRLPKQSVRAAMMAFGGGALLFALSIELFGHVLHEAEVRDDNNIVYTMIGASLFGGLFFAWLNRMLNNHGADIRHAATHKPKINRLRKLLSRRLLAALQKVALFKALTPGELQHYIVRKLQRRRVNKGHQVFGPESTGHHAGTLYMVLRGKVELTRGTLQTERTAEKEPVEWKTEVGKYQFFAEGSLLMPFDEVHDAERRGTVVSAECTRETMLLMFPGDDVLSLMKEDSNIGQVLVPLWKAWVVERLFEMSSYFNPVPAQQWEEQLFPHMKVIDSDKGDEVLHTSTESSPILFILFGQIEFSSSTEVGQREVARASTVIGMEHIKTGRNFALRAVATEETCLISIARVNCLNNFLVKHPAKSKIPEKKSMQPLSLKGRECKSVAVPSSLPGLIPSGEQEAVTKIKSDGASVDRSKPPLAPLFDNSSMRGSHGSSGSTTSGATAIVPLDASADGTDSKHVQRGTVVQRGHTHQRRSFQLAKEGISRFTKARFSLDLKLNGDTERRKRSLVGDVQVDGMSGWDMVLAGCQEVAKERAMHPRSDFSNEQETLAFLTEDELNFEATADLTSEADFDLGGEQTDNHPRGSRFNEASSSLKVNAWVDGSEAEPARKEKSGQGMAKQTSSNKVGHGHGHGSGHGGGSASAAIMVWVGILLDAVPESLVIGILVVQSGGPPLPFIIGVFLSNLPEAMSSSGTMLTHGLRKRVIFAMWLGVVAVTSIGAVLGAILFPPTAMEDESTFLIVVGVEGIAAGAMLTMIAQTMLPEAFEQGGDVVGLSCLLGFLAALCVRLLPVGNDH